VGNLAAPSGVPDAVEHDLVQRARRGDAQAFGALVTAHRAIALRTARACTPTDADAEEAVQEALLKAWAALPGFRDGAPFRPWLLAIVANEARSRTRAEQRRDGWTRRLARERPPQEHGPEDAALAAERRAALRVALEALPARDREALGLRYAAGLSEQEMAGVLAVRPGTVKSRLSRALERLRADPAARGALLGTVGALLLVAVAVPPTRAALLEVLGLGGGERVVRTTAPPPAAGAALSGRPVDAAQASRLLGRPVRSLGPGERFLARGRTVVAVRGADRLEQRPGGGLVAQKEVGAGTEVRAVSVAGRPGLLLTGAPFARTLLDGRGAPLDATRRRVPGTVVLWERDGLALRLHTPRDAAGALAVARAVSASR